MRLPGGLASALLAALLFGSVNAVAKAALADVHPLTALALTYALAALVLAPFARRLHFTRRDALLLVGATVAGGILAPLALFYALAATTAVEASLLLNAEALATGLLAGFLLRERLSAREWAGYALILGGLVTVTLPPVVGAGGFEAAHVAANLLVVAAGVGWALDNTFSTPLAARHDARGLIAWKAGAGAAVVLAAALVGGAPLPTDGRPLLLLAVVGILGVGVSSLLFYRALSQIGATRTSVIFASSTLVGIAAGRVFLDETVRAYHVLGAALVIGGVLALALAHRPAAPVGPVT